MKYIRNFFIFLFCILLFCYSILQIPSVKQFTIKKSIEFINSKADFKISYEKFFYEDLKNISFSGITIENKNNHKELLKLQKIQVGINLFNLFLKRELNFKNLDFVDLVLLVDKNKNTFLNSKTEQIDFKLVNFFSIHVENINFINCAIVFDNDDFEKNPENFFDVNHFRIAEINSHLQKIIFSKDGISGSVKKFSASGDKILLKDLNLDAKYCNDKIKLEKIFIDSNYGKLSGNLEACNLNDQEKFNYTLDLQNLTVDAKKIPSLKSFDSEISLGCKVKGNLQDSFIQECRCFYKKNSLSFSGFVKNFVEREKLQYQIDKISGNFNLRSFPQIISSEIINMLPCKSGEFYGSLQGKSREGNLILNLQSAAGNISSNFNFANIFSQNLKFAGNIDLQKVNLKNFGITDINSNHEIKFSPEEKKLENKISELNYMDVNIKDIKCTIQGDEKNYFGFLKIDDKNLKTSLNFKNYDDIICCLGHCDLQNLNQFFKSEKNIIIKNDIDIKIKTKTNDISAIFSNNFLKFGANDFNLKTLKTDFERKKFFFTLNLFSDFGDIKIYDIPENVKDVKNIFLQFWENLYNWTENRELKISKDPNFKIPFYVNLKDDKIFSLLGQDVSCGCTNFYGEFLNVEGEKILTLNTDKIRNIKIEDKNFTNTDFSLTIGLNEKKNLPIFNVFCEIDKADSKDFFVDNIIFKIESQDKSINTHLTLKNNIFKFALNLKSFFEDGKIIFDLKDEESSCILNSWKLNNEGFIKITNKNISVENLTFGKNQMNFICDYDLNLDSTGWKNKFLLQIKNVKIENWKKYIKDEIKGFLNGKIKKDNTSFLDIYLDLDELQISKNDFENINLKTQYNVEKKIYDYSLLLKKEDNINLDVNGFFENENKKINAKCKFNNFDLQIFEIFTEPICDKLSGSLNGALSIFGNFESPKFGGELDLTNGNVSFSDIKTEFHANGHFKGDSEDLQIVNLEIKDNKLGNALLNGKMKIKFNEFPTLDLSGKVNEIQILNTKEKDNHIFYGNLFCSGDVHFFGPLNFLTIAGDVQNEKNSEIFFNFKNEITNYDFIHFIAEEEEKVGKVKKNIAKQVYNGIKLDLGTTINQNLRAFIKIPFSNIEVQGDGNLHIVTTLNEDWNLKGTLNVKKGTYLFSLKNFLNKKFQIKEGGTVNFFGNIDQATLNIVATENIILGKSKDENLVTLKIITSGLLENPNIKYDIDLSKSQNIAADIRSKIKTNEERRNNYFLNLLLFRNFEGNFSNISSNILNLFERTIKKSDAKNLFQISLDSDKLFPDNLSNLNVVYNFSDKFEISKKQKISNKMFNLRDLSEDLEVRYSINDDVKVYTNIEKNQTFNLGFKIFN